LKTRSLSVFGVSVEWEGALEEVVVVLEEEVVVVLEEEVVVVVLAVAAVEGRPLRNMLKSGCDMFTRIVGPLWNSANHTQCRASGRTPI
jgi:hypothetical protein